MSGAREPLLCVFGLLFVLCACGDDDVVTPAVDSGVDAPIVRDAAGPPPMCGSNRCGSPLVGDHCCTQSADVASDVATAAERCGVSFGALVPELGAQCVELRQPGTLDNRCPARSVGSGVESGCCTSQGVCGTLNQAADLGCQRVLMLGDPPIECGAASLDAGHEPDADL